MSGHFGSAFPGGYQQPPLFAPTPTPFSPPRKRRADSPPTDLQWAPPEQKRRRPNLSNGFATMSISPQPDEPKRSQYLARGLSTESSDDELEPTRLPPGGDVAVEVLSDKSPTSIRHPLFPHSRSSSSTPPSDDDYESDATYRPPLERARLRQAHHTPIQPTWIEHPEQPEPAPPTFQGTPTIEFESPLKRKHLRLDDERPDASKRQRSHMDQDVAMEPVPIASGPGWYEPEKDRIVVTSLSSPESSTTRSPSPDPGPRRQYSYEEHKHLMQPGDDGFTISPSLLTHLMTAQSDQFRKPAFHAVPERGLVLYRPLGVSPAEDVVQKWEEEPGRFEVLDDDEDMQTQPAGQWGDGITQEWGRGDDAMDIG
ncbi:hypothetical protein CcaverHIS002_0104570 [Cutaneotrichosporon cavernicola]|uniref:Uncharacterized protein n=1 Tax=Cutaneotrichosporon cavernicola TaxID=279322 RepID=A0AA48I1L3_9TREE|nr:uncharacterized protein CcaverHIS019_0104500 [Cutaneotrichosporon cavernicola]BEI79928.1 hypothetical protein CcaverHIS002_0104570 [Cutaneotrichosporon cavernicola]BEI87732.1 hypothetical protein CcaverHIS019_0104500 [Cutaneotrichosporon cavernicola]BEI95504.1 hypothetical protein CcaverHIS631_0104530 [Cutaneotrichosporon cavernicola]BEJ03278.1 hypothetical protein CcaverHIS641_0104530 [Cutaneotrichosporon cavernicola]